MNERERALELLRRIDRQSLYASIVLAGESGFVRTLVLGVLRWRSRLDFVIASLAGRRVEKIDPIVLEILRVGVYQLLYMNVAPHAAVSETVNIAAKRASRARGFVNAVLRKATGNVPEPADLATRTAHPPWLIDRWTKFYGAERAAAIAEADQELSYPDVLALGGEAPDGGEPSKLAPDMFRLTESTADLDRTRFYPMDEGSAVIAAIARAAGDDVLDLAAAPGSKSIWLAAHGARVVSNDISLTRLLPLRMRDAKIVVSDAARPPFRRRFETVLLDAPCSATGTIRKNPEIKWRLAENDLAAFHQVQVAMLRSALEIASRTCVYSTCSLEPEENDAVVEEAVGDSAFELADATPYVPEGARAWVRDGILRLTPDSGADGFTAFVIRRSR